MARPGDPHARIDLLRAAEHVFVERGLRDAKVEEITARAGRSKGSFYLHFQSKEDAFREIVETLLARLGTIVEGCVASEPELDELADAWLAGDLEIFEFLWQNRGVMRLCLGGGGGVDFAYLVDEFAERARDNAKAMLERGVSRGYYRADLDVEIVSMLVAGAYDRIAREIVKQTSRPDLRAWLIEVQRFVVLGLASPALRQMDDPPVSERSPTPRAARGRRSPARARDR